jgi:hypothetical protein
MGRSRDNFEVGFSHQQPAVQIYMGDSFKNQAPPGSRSELLEGSPYYPLCSKAVVAVCNRRLDDSPLRVEAEALDNSSNATGPIRPDLSKPQAIVSARRPQFNVLKPFPPLVTGLCPAGCGRSGDDDTLLLIRDTSCLVSAALSIGTEGVRTSLGKEGCS